MFTAATRELNVGARATSPLETVVSCAPALAATNVVAVRAASVRRNLVLRILDHHLHLGASRRPLVAPALPSHCIRGLPVRCEPRNLHVAVLRARSHVRQALHLIASWRTLPYATPLPAPGCTLRAARLHAFTLLAARYSVPTLTQRSAPPTQRIVRRFDLQELRRLDAWTLRTYFRLAPSCLRAASPAGVYRDPQTPTAVFTLARHVHLTMPSPLHHQSQS